MGEFIEHWIAENGYLGVAFLMFLETVFPPIPSEIIMAVAGLHAASGEMSLGSVIAAGTFGAMLGNYVWFLFARWLGIERFEPFIRRWGRWLTLSMRDIEKGKRFFEEHGAAFVLFARMLPTLRSLISVPAGLLHMDTRRFLIYSTIGTAGWTTLIALVGYRLGQNYAMVEALMGPVANAVIATLVIGYLWRVATWRP